MDTDIAMKRERARCDPALPAAHHGINVTIAVSESQLLWDQMRRRRAQAQIPTDRVTGPQCCCAAGLSHVKCLLTLSCMDFDNLRQDSSTKCFLLLFRHEKQVADALLCHPNTHCSDLYTGRERVKRAPTCYHAGRLIKVGWWHDALIFLSGDVFSTYIIRFFFFKKKENVSKDRKDNGCSLPVFPAAPDGRSNKTLNSHTKRHLAERQVRSYFGRFSSSSNLKHL